MNDNLEIPIQSGTGNFKRIVAEAIVIGAIFAIALISLDYFKILNFSASEKGILQKPTKTTSSETKTTPLPNQLKTAQRFGSALDTSSIINNSEGQIIEIDNNPGTVKLLNNFSYIKKITIRGNGPQPSYFYFDDQMIAATKVTGINGEELSVNGLKVGDNLKLSFNWQLDSQTNKYSKFVSAEIKVI